MELNTVKDTFDRVVKKQKLSCTKSQEVIDLVGSEIEQVLATIQSANDPLSPDDLKSILSVLKHKLIALGPLLQLEASQKGVNASITKYPKVLEKFFHPALSKAYRNVDFDFHLVNQIIATHFYRHGLFDLGDSLLNESGEPEATELKSQFMELHEILEAMKVKNIEPALNWVSANREKLKDNDVNLELNLHGLQFVKILEKGNRIDALNYARKNLAHFAPPHTNVVQKHMASLVWSGKLDSSPYADLVAPSRWDNLTEELSRQFCSLMGQSYKSPLNVAVAAGVEGLPTLLKLAKVMAGKEEEWQTMKHLPVPLELGKEFQFHSVFVCPVSRDQGTEENPPMLLPCLHVLCKQSIMKLSKSSSRLFKCPYCPAEASVAQCRQLYF